MYDSSMDLRVFNAKNLKAVRKEKEISQQKLAEITGLSLSLISKYEQGSTLPTTEKLSKIGQALGVYFVIPWEDEEPPLLGQGLSSK